MDKTDKLTKVEGKENVGEVLIGSAVDEPAVGHPFRFIHEKDGKEVVRLTTPVREVFSKGDELEEVIIIKTQNSVYALEFVTDGEPEPPKAA